MTTTTTARIERLARTGHAPTLSEARAAAAQGRLWDVDTRSDGHDAVVIADDADEALAEVATHADRTADDASARGWTVARVDGVD